MRRVLRSVCVAFVCLLVAGSTLAAPMCLAELECWDGSWLECIGRTCKAVRSDCSVPQAGWISCDGTVYSCPSCPSPVASFVPSDEAQACRAGADEGAVAAALAE